MTVLNYCCNLNNVFNQSISTCQISQEVINLRKNYYTNIGDKNHTHL